MEKKTNKTMKMKKIRKIILFSPIAARRVSDFFYQTSDSHPMACYLAAKEHLSSLQGRRESPKRRRADCPT